MRNDDSTRDNPTEEQEGELLTTEQTCELLGITRPTLYAMRREGLIAPIPGNPVLKIQKRNYYRREDVMRLKQQGRGKPAKAND